MLRLNTRYLLYATILFIIEVLIALYVHDNFVRPYVGDYLVVMLMYAFVRAFVASDLRLTLLGVLMFSYVIEILQYLNIVERLGLGSNELARTVIGTSFHWYDILAYTLGILTVLWMEFKFNTPHQP